MCPIKNGVGVPHTVYRYSVSDPDMAKERNFDAPIEDGLHWTDICFGAGHILV